MASGFHGGEFYPSSAYGGQNGGGGWMDLAASNSTGSSKAQKKRDRAAAGLFEFEDILLSWSEGDLTGTSPPASSPALPKERLPSSWLTRGEYFDAFKPLVLEEARATLVDGFNRNRGRGHPVELLRVTPPNAEAGQAYTMLFRRLRGMEWTRPGTVFLLAPTRRHQFRRLGIAGNNFSRDVIELRVLLPPKVAEELGDENLSPNAHWQVTPTSSVIVHQRMYDACYAQPDVPFLRQVYSGDYCTRIANMPGAVPSPDDEWIAHLGPMASHPRAGMLNHSQQEAVGRFLYSHEELQLVQGPPGTGKTTTILTLLSILVEAGQRVLVCAPSNKAVQELCVRYRNASPAVAISLVGVEEALLSLDPTLSDVFVHTWPVQLATSLRQVSVSLMEAPLNIGVIQQIGDTLTSLREQLETKSPAFSKRHQVAERWMEVAGFLTWLVEFAGGNVSRNTASYVEQCAARQPSLANGITVPAVVQAVTNVLDSVAVGLDTDSDDRGGALIAEQLNSARVVFATLAVTGRRGVRAMKAVDVLIVDEAGQAVEAETLIAFQCKPRKCLLVGDPKQLPATTLSQAAVRLGYERSIMERLMNECQHPSVLLDTQYRMHPAISAWPSANFYGGRIKDSDLVKSGARDLAVGAPYLAPVAFVNVVHGGEQSQGSSCTNVDEALMCAVYARHLGEVCGLNLRKDVIIITFYAAQVAFLRDVLKREGLGDCAVHTVDSFQGSEAEVVLVSCVRSNARGTVGFLADARRLNVGLTRARKSLVMFGSAPTLDHSRSDTSRLVASCYARGHYFQCAEVLQHMSATTSPGTRRLIDTVLQRCVQLTPPGLDQYVPQSAPDLSPHAYKMAQGYPQPPFADRKRLLDAEATRKKGRMERQQAHAARLEGMSAEEAIAAGTRCDVCKITYTSAQAAKDHLTGKRHLKAVAAAALAEGGEVPMEVEAGRQGAIAKAESRGGSYCDLCDTVCESLAAYQAHMSGKKHLKNVAKAAAPPAENGANNNKPAPKTAPNIPQSRREGYYCHVCNVSCESSVNFQLHMNGKRHQKLAGGKRPSSAQGPPSKRTKGDMPPVPSLSGADLSRLEEKKRLAQEFLANSR